MGMGDVKLLVLIGVYVGFPGNFISLFFGVLIAAVVIIIGFIFKQMKFGKTIPFGPFIALGSLMFVLAGESVIQWYLGFVAGSGR